MSVSKSIFLGSVSLFLIIGCAAFIKKNKNSRSLEMAPPVSTESVNVESIEGEKYDEFLKPVKDKLAEHDQDVMWRLFTTGKQKLPIVETIRYKARVDWLKNRPAWISDYASHYSTSRHFIARSLNKKKDYYTQKINQNDQFNILKEKISFYIVVDLSRCKMWLYALDDLQKTHILLKTYKVGLGRYNSESFSGVLTPRGKFTLGDKVAVYAPGNMGYFQDNQIEMVTVFGSRWIPFDKDLGNEGDNPKGYGFHGAPWLFDPDSKLYTEDCSTVGGYESDGCIRLMQDDIEELYAIVITKPTVVEIVSDYHDANIPGAGTEP